MALRVRAFYAATAMLATFVLTGCGSPPPPGGAANLQEKAAIQQAMQEHHKGGAIPEIRGIAGKGGATK